jgi:HK97 family phage major capsid protein
MGRTFEDFKKENDQRLKQVESKGHADPLLEEKVNKTNDAIGKLETSIGEIKTALARPNLGAIETDEQKAAKSVIARKHAFLKMLRKGEQSLSAEEVKTLSVSDDTQGGYLVPREIEKSIIRNLANVNVMRSLASVQQISVGNMLEQPRRTAGITGTWTSESGSNPSAANPTYGMLRISAEEMRALVKATSQSLEDPEVDLESLVNDEATEAFANLEGAAFVTGTGVGRPKGIMAYASGTGDGQIEQIVSGTAATIADATGQADGLLTMPYKLKATYAKNGQFLLNRLTTGSVRKLKDNNKQYIWAPGLGSQPPTILGYSYFEDDNVAVEGAGNLVIAFGDFKRAYKIVDKIGMAVIRDQYTSKPMVEWLFRKRTGGAVEIFEAVKILKCST